MSIPQQGGGPIERREQLAEYIASGEKPREDWRIGTEHEKFGYTKPEYLPLPYDGERSIKAMLEGLQQRFGWTPVLEQDKIIGLERNGANVSLEPGGQLELSGAPLETIHQTCDEVNQHLAEVREIAEKIGVGFIGLGAAPIWRQSRSGLVRKMAPRAPGLSSSMARTISARTLASGEPRARRSREVRSCCSRRSMALRAVMSRAVLTRRRGVL